MKEGNCIGAARPESTFECYRPETAAQREAHIQLQRLADGLVAKETAILGSAPRRGMRALRTLRTGPTCAITSDREGLRALVTRHEILEPLRLDVVVAVFRVSGPPTASTSTPVMGPASRAAQLNTDFHFPMSASTATAKCRERGVGALLFTLTGRFLATVDHEGQVKLVGGEDGEEPGATPGAVPGPASEPLFYLVSLRWSAAHVAFWRPNVAGYTVDLNQAGRYTAEQADNHTGDETIAVSSTAIERFARPAMRFVEVEAVAMERARFLRAEDRRRGPTVTPEEAALCACGCDPCRQGDHWNHDVDTGTTVCPAGQAAEDAYRERTGEPGAPR